MTVTIQQLEALTKWWEDYDMAVDSFDEIHAASPAHYQIVEMLRAAIFNPTVQDAFNLALRPLDMPTEVTWEQRYRALQKIAGLVIYWAYFLGGGLLDGHVKAPPIRASALPDDAPSLIVWSPQATGEHRDQATGAPPLTSRKIQ